MNSIINSTAYATIGKRLFEYYALPYLHTTTIGSTLRNKLIEKWTRKHLMKHSNDKFSLEILHMPKVIKISFVQLILFTF